MVSALIVHGLVRRHGEEFVADVAPMKQRHQA